MTDYRLFWGEAHDNTYQFNTHRAGQEPSYIAMALERAAAHLDFYAAAYYTAQSDAFEEGGHLSEQEGPMRIALEGWKSEARLAEEWQEIQACTREADDPGAFVAFPGYEWQGDGSSGDHNVCFRQEGGLIHRVATLPELYGRLRGQDAIAIPHHTAYRPGVRGKDWSVLDERLSPFSEIFSIHGCSETDEEWIGLRQNSHMGPGIGPGTWQAALDRGLHLGCVCGTDNWGDMPGHYGWGRMACFATELTREGLWEAFLARRVYGVSGDRIRVDFRVNDQPMGSMLHGAGPRRIAVRVVGSDALDRIELLRGSRVIATHCHQGAWRQPAPGTSATFKLRIEAGWGPRPGEVDVPDRMWDGELVVSDGEILGVERCWVSVGQGTPALGRGRAAFRMRSAQKDVGRPRQNANVFELRADPAVRVRVRMNGLEEEAALAELAASSREMWFCDECVQMLADRAGLAPGSPERDDVYHGLAYKVKVHRAIPEAGYTAALDFEDDEPFDGEIHYRARVEQRNGQRAWTSPVWVQAG